MMAFGKDRVREKVLNALLGYQALHVDTFCHIVYTFRISCFELLGAIRNCKQCILFPLHCLQFIIDLICVAGHQFLQTRQSLLL